MKKVARLRIPAEEAYAAPYSQISPVTAEQVGVRTTGRIKKPKAVFDPSDNYLPRSQRASSATTASGGNAGDAADRKKLSIQSFMAESLQGKKVSRLSSNSSSSTTNTATSSSLPDPVEVCGVCLKREAKRGTYAKNKLISCLDCDKKVHKLCLKVDFEDLDTLRQNYKCDNCRSCDVCAAFSELDSKDKELVTCAKCVKSYHLNCHIPSVLKFQQHQRNWKCNKCTLPVLGNGSILPVKTIREIIGDEPITARPAAPQQLDINIEAAAAEAKNAATASAAGSTKRTLIDLQNGPQINGVDLELECHGEPKKRRASADNVDAVNELPTTGPATVSTSIRYSPNEPMDIPDVKDWSVDQVVEFFAKYFPNEAYVFKDQEIDGMSLLLLKRSDVIKKLPIKLGPSLRIYSMILKIQTQLNDATLGWNCGL